MELDILHKTASSQHIVDFYGAFFVETCVYYCMEYMDGGSLDRLVNVGFGETVPALNPGSDDEKEVVWQGVPEDVLARIAGSMVKGLKFLKDELDVIHRGIVIPPLNPSYSWLILTCLDVKPSNVLINYRGQIKLCDFGVSGQLEKSIAKTNIGCQTYMAVSVHEVVLVFINLYLYHIARKDFRRTSEHRWDIHCILRRLVCRLVNY